MTEVERKRPSSGAWGLVTVTAEYTGYRYAAKPPLCVLSSVDLVKGSRSGKICPHWHVSISLGPSAMRRPTDDEADQVLRAFGMQGAEEDNHLPRGIARQFWLAVDPEERVECPCKDEEPPHVEEDGYTWREVGRD